MAARCAPLSVRELTEFDSEQKYSARQLLDAVRVAYGIESLYHLAKCIGVSPSFTQYWHRENTLSQPARALLLLHLSIARGRLD